MYQIKYYEYNNDNDIIHYTTLYVQIVHFMAENYTLYFRLSPRTHNYIVSKLGNCILGRLISRLCKYIYNTVHCKNINVQQIVKCKLLSPTSILTDYYIYLCNKYNIAHSDWYRETPFITNYVSFVMVLLIVA